MALVRLLHWKAAEAEPLLEVLMRAGHKVDYEEQFRPEFMREWRKSPPDLFVIDLSRLPSHGKEIAIALRQSPATRCRPVVFCGGEDRKVDALRALLPDAAYCDVRSLKRSVNAALRANPADGVAPGPPPVAMMNRYGSRTPSQKLGIRPGCKVALLEPPAHVESILAISHAT